MLLRKRKWIFFKGNGKEISIKNEIFFNESENENCLTEKKNYKKIKLKDIVTLITYTMHNFKI